MHDVEVRLGRFWQRGYANATLILSLVNDPPKIALLLSDFEGD
jgi:hypothetical protein